MQYCSFLLDMEYHHTFLLQCSVTINKYRQNLLLYSDFIEKRKSIKKVQSISGDEGLEYKPKALYFYLILWIDHTQF